MEINCHASGKQQSLDLKPFSVLSIILCVLFSLKPLLNHKDLMLLVFNSKPTILMPPESIPFIGRKTFPTKHKYSKRHA